MSRTQENEKEKKSKNANANPNVTRREALSKMGTAAIGAGAVVVIGGVAYYLSSQAPPAPSTMTTARTVTEVVTASSPAGPVTLTVMKSPHGPDDPDFFKKYEDQFAAKYPGTKIVHTVPGWGELPTALTSSIAGGNAPDVAYLPTRFIYQWGDANALIPLAEMATSDVIDSWKAKFPDPVWRAGVYKNKALGLPYISVARELIYNVDLLNKAGIDKPPTTWDEFYDAAKKMTDSAHGIYGFGVGLQEEGFTMEGWIWQAGGDYLIVKEDGTTWSGLDSKECLAAGTFVRKLYKDGVAMPVSGVGWDQINSAAYAGKLGMTLFEPFSFSTSIMSKYPDIHLAVAAPLQGPDTDSSDIGHYRAAYFDSGDWCVFRQSRNPKAAWELAQLLSSEDSEKAYCAHTGMFPVMSSLMDLFANDKFYNDFLKEPIHLKYGRAPSAWDMKAKTVANSPYASAVDPVITELETDLAIVQMDPAAALQKAHANCNGVLKALGAH